MRGERDNLRVAGPCEAFDVNPVAYLADVLVSVQTHPASRIA
jgi:hypothetical protein